MASSYGEVYDIGYRHYAGPREGRARARKALWGNGVRTALGIGRGWSSKVLPILLFVALLAPALVFAVLASTLGDLAQDLPGADDYYQGAIIPLMIFSAIVAPELLCADRRSGAMSLYLVRPLTARDYLLGRWAAFLSVVLVAIYVPQVVLLVGTVLGAASPLDYLRDHWLDVPRFLGAGLVLALFASTLPLAAAAFTTRRAYAAVFVIGLLIISSAVAHAFAENVDANLGRWLILIDIWSVPIHLNDTIFAKATGSDVTNLARRLPDALIVGWYAVVVAVPAAVLWLKHGREAR